MKQHLLIITGLPFAGKSTLRKELVKRYGFSHASVDEFISSGNFVVEEMTQNDWNTVYSQAYEKLARLLRNGKTVIFDGGSLLKSERDTLKKIAVEAGVPSKLIYVNTSESDILERRVRSQAVKDRDPLKDVVMDKALGMFEEPDESENPILYNHEMNLDSWIKNNIEEV